MAVSTACPAAAVLQVEEQVERTAVVRTLRRFVSADDVDTTNSMSATATRLRNSIANSLRNITDLVELKDDLLSSSRVKTFTSF